MESGREEAILFHEDLLKDPASPHQNEDASEDEDDQKELEEMLYSRVYYDDSSLTLSTSIPSSNQKVTLGNVRVKEVQRKLGFASSGIHEKPKSLPALDLQASCSQSQFNNPSRKKASRYYDINKDKTLTFKAPPIYSQKSTSDINNVIEAISMPSPTMSRIIGQSPKEKTSTPQTLHPTRKEVIDDATQVSHPKDLSKDVQGLNTIEKVNDSSNAMVGCDSVNGMLMVNPSNKSANTQSEKKEKSSDIVLTKPGPRSFKLNNQRTLEAKISKVLSSMLDEESRSSIDESHPAPKCSSQDLKNPSADSGWSVGMPWDDMSPKFCFEADSIEEESVSSSQIREGSPASSQTSTANLPADVDDESRELSRYSLNLKKTVIQDEEKEVDHHETDSESEVGSVVEVAPPIKPLPPLVELSDGELAPVNDSNRNTPIAKSKRAADISIIPSHSKNCFGGITTAVVIDSSSDDDLVVLEVLDSSRSKHRESLSIPMKRVSLDASQAKAVCGIPPKRPFQAPSNQRELITDEERCVLKQGEKLMEDSEVLKLYLRRIDKLEQWLHDPIKSTKLFDHKRFLKNMSDNPKLWKICYTDQIVLKSPGGGPKCVNCNQFGHSSKSCPSPLKVIVCHMCGVSGHSETRCSKKMCLRCGKLNNVFIDRCKSCASNQIPCKICQSLLHEWKSCPDLWRRFHLTTTSGEIVEPAGHDLQPISKRWCSNCAQNGHLSYECKKARWKCESISPFIKSYATIDDEELKREGPSSALILFNDADAKALLSPEGQLYLTLLASEHCVSFSQCLTGAVKKIVIEGTSLAQEKCRTSLLNWTAEQREKNCLKEVKNIREVANILPKKRKSLFTLLSKTLQSLNQPSCRSVKELYRNICILQKKKILSHCQQRKLNRLRSKLSFVLFGQCGFKDGHIHVQELRNIVSTIQKKGGKKTMEKIRSKAEIHYNYIFNKLAVEDLKSLVDQFYSDEALVEKFDPHNKKLRPSTSKIKDICQSTAQNFICPLNQVANEGIDSNQTLPPMNIPPSAQTPVKKSMSKVSEKVTPVSKQTRRILPDRKCRFKFEEMKIGGDVRFVLQNLASRFIHSKEGEDLCKFHLKYQNMTVSPEKQILADRLRELIVVLCEKHKILL